MSYQDTSLWKRTLGKDDKNVEPLRESFLRGREHAKSLLKKIREDFENLTMHDITHVDSLWNVADVIIGDEYPINPLEGYVLGVAFLIHDAALSYEAVGGVVELRRTIEWNDEFADGPGEMDKDKFEKECDFIAIRAIHSEKAASVLEKIFSPLDETSNDYVKHYGKLIGEIAASHHWDIDKVASKLSIQINPMSGMPRDWTINAQKLACILRCADAGHIDNGRAPDSIYRSLDVNGVSREHWEFQNHLGQVCEYDADKSKLCITSDDTFSEKNFAAWNVAYDAIRLFDEELKKSNSLLKTIDSKLIFPHIGICGADSKEALAEFVKTEDWQPCSFGVHASNVKAMIENLGGGKLYGQENKLFVVMRELIQNARDAIHARCALDEHFKEGKITVRLVVDNKKRWLEVEDNGIGMSLDCIKHFLLDFGNSYWKSNLAKQEHLGLRSKGFKSIGKYGIGFYSVFMVAKSVEIVTRRYDKGEDDAKKIKFPEGLTLSPILSKTKLSSLVSTIVKFELKSDVDIEYRIYGLYTHIIFLYKALSVIVAGLDVDVFFEWYGKSFRVHQNVKSSEFDQKEWLMGLLLHKPVNIDKLALNLEKLTDEKGNQRGLLLSPEWVDIIDYPNNSDGFFAMDLIPSIKTIGGLASALELHDNYNYCGFLGYVDGIEDGISRNEMILDNSLKKCLQVWAKKKYRENRNQMIVSESLSDSYQRLISFCGLKEEMIQDNLRWFYFANRDCIEVGTINGLIDIHKVLSVGVLKNSGRIRGYNRKDIKLLFDASVNEEEKNRILENIKRDEKVEVVGLVNELVRINDMPASYYTEILEKYWKLLMLHPFTDGNKIALGVWVNLMLDKLKHQMIDWRKVDMSYFSTLLNRRIDYIAFRYLEQFLSPIYLSEIISPLTKNN